MQFLLLLRSSKQNLFPGHLGRFLCFCTLWVAVPGWGQATSGSIVVYVKDPQGAVSQQATVEVSSQETGLVERAETGSKGSCELSNLPPGHYAVRVHQSGFSLFSTQPLELQIDEKLRVDVALKLGQATETVLISDAVPLLQTQSAAMGQVINGSDISNMPLLGRDFTDLILLVPGVVRGDGGNNVNLSVDGQREFGNSIQLNGVEVTGNRNNDTSLRPSVDAMKEFKVVTADYAPEFGRASGGAILLETKAGTNQFHGAAYEFFRPSNTCLLYTSTRKREIVIEQPRPSAEACEAESPSLVFAAQSGKDREIDQLSQKMHSWGRLWFGSSSDRAPTEKDDLVRERLLSWLERCIGLQVRALLTTRVEDVSLATSVPLLTALLGRRATLELSRRVLNDL